MSDVLLAGNVGLLGPDVIGRLVDDHRLVVAHGPQQAEAPCVQDARTRACELARDAEGLARLFDIYSFDTVVYVSGFADGGTGIPDEQDLLGALLTATRQAGVDKLVYLTSFIPAPEDVDAAARPAAEPCGPTGFSPQTILLANQQEELCRFLLGASGTALVTIRLPFLAEPSAADGFLARLFGHVADGEATCLPFIASDPADFLTARDLGALLAHVVEEPGDAGGAYMASSGYAHTWGELSDMLNALPGRPRPDGPRVTCADRMHALPAPATIPYPAQLRRAYGWVPFDDALTQLPALYEAFLARRPAEERLSLAQRVRGLLGGLGWVKYVELVALFAVVQALNDALGANIYYRFVDVRLLYVVIMGSMHGMRLGILASLLACASVLAAYAGQGTSLTSLMMRVENWLPFALYFLVGAITGYLTDRQNSRVAFTQAEHALLVDKYRFLNEAYTSAIDNKRLYKHQILGFEDSFGRIYSLVQRLDDVTPSTPQELYLKAIDVLEDVLRNRSVALYSVDESQRYARLAACSRPMRAQLPKSQDLGSWRACLDEVREGGVWRNTALAEGLPDFACGSVRAGRLQMVVCVWQADNGQHDMRFANLLKVICGLLEMSLRRAHEYARLAREELCLPGTEVVRAEPFARAVQAQREMAGRGIADYVLLGFPGLTPEEAQARLAPQLRVTDELGIGADGSVQALLRQADASGMQAVGARLKAAGLEFEPIEG